MEIGTEISQTIKTSIKNKLLELGSYIDDELPEYILVMIANKRSKAQMTDDLGLFLGGNTEKFTVWLHNMLQKLKDATSMEAEETTAELTKIKPSSLITSPLVEETQLKDTGTPVDVKVQQVSKVRALSPVTAPHKAASQRSFEDHSTGKRKDVLDGTKHHTKESEGQRRRSVSSSVVKVAHINSRKRHHSLDETDEDNEESSKRKSQGLASIVKVRESGSSVPVSMQASSSLIKRAVAEAQQSCTKLASSMGYDPSVPPLLYSQGNESKQRQKELLLQQHRQLRKMHQEQQDVEKIEPEVEHKKEHEEEVEEVAEEKEDEEEEEEEVEEEEEEQEDSDFSHVEEDPTSKSVQEPEIELHVSDDEALNLDPAVAADKDSEPQALAQDMRVVAFADSQGGSDDEKTKDSTTDKKEKAVEGDQKHVKSDSHRSSSSSSSSRHRKHGRAVKAKKKLQPKFIVTLEGVSSDYEDKFEEELENNPAKFAEKLRKLPVQSRLGLFPPISAAFPPLGMGHPQFTQPHLPPQLLLPQSLMVLPPQPMPQAPPLHIQQQPLPPNHLQTVPLPPPHPPYSTPQATMPGQFTSAGDGSVLDAPPDTTIMPVPELSQPAMPYQDNSQMVAYQEQAMDEDPSSFQEKPYERCVFWPDCAKGDACPFHHPVAPCRTFPKCKFGDKCFFIHPPCKFDGRCANTSCPFQHSSKAQAPKSPPPMPTNQPTKGLVNAPLSTIACKYHPSCTRTNCPFMHPSSKTSVGSRKACRFGSSCTRTDCNFSHTTSPKIHRESSAFKWVANKHISERSFATPESDVTPLIVK